MNTEIKKINFNHSSVEQPHGNIVNYEELFMNQTGAESLEVHINVEAHDAINVISIVQHIAQQQLHTLYEIDRKGNYRPSIMVLHKLFYTLEKTVILKDKYDVAEIDIFVESLKKYIPEHRLIGNEEAIFWKMHQSTVINSVRIGLVKANFLNSLVNGILELTQKPTYKQAVQNRLERSQNQFQKGMKLINELFEVYCKLLIMRLDFALKAESNLSLSHLKKLMSKFLKKILVSNGDLQGIKGHIWKLEYGIQKGYHYHCIFFMDGSKHSKDSYYAQKLGQLWKTVTEDQGIFHNCNTSKFKYRHLAIGCISYDDEDARKNLEILMSYLSKTDQFLIEKTLKKYRVFGTSTRQIKKSQSGRPRENLKN